MAEWVRAALIGIGLAKTLWTCCCCCGGVRVKGSFLEVGEGRKNSDTLFDNTPSGEDTL